MKFTSIRQKLTFYVVSLILVLVSFNVVFGILHVFIVNKYQKVEDNIFLQYHLITATQEIITDYNDYRNVPTSINLDKYLSTHKDITDTISVLKQNIVNEASKDAFIIVKNTISNVLSEVDKGIEAIKTNDITNTSFYYVEANRKFNFVKGNTEDLILTEIDYSHLLELDIQKINQVTLIIGISVLIFITLLSIIISIFWARKLVSPLLKIILIAKTIASGNLATKIDAELLERRDEIGDLTRAFNDMTIKLKKSYFELEEQIKETEAKSIKLEEQIKETEKSKLAILNLLQDIEEEKKKVEEIVVIRTQELNDEKARLVASINSLSFGFIIADMNNKVLLQNQAMIDLFGLSNTDESSIEHISQLLEGQFDIKNRIELCLKDKDVCEIKEIMSGDKSLRGIIAPVVTPGSDKPIGYVFLLEDITEARAIDRAKTEFVSLASHQLRTPLSAINWYSEMLVTGDAGELNSQQKEFIDEICRSSKRMSELVSTLLNVSRIELGSFSIDPKEQDLCLIVNSEIEDLKVPIFSKDLKVQVSCNLKPAIISVDSNLISIVIQNLLTNAVKYTPNGGAITVAVDEDVENGGGVLLSVIDAGVGIENKDLHKIFTKMYRGDNARTIDSDGNGLGLYMVKSILESSGCKIWFESPPKGNKEGTAFYVYIPKEGMKQKSGAKHLTGIVS